MRPTSYLGSPDEELRNKILREHQFGMNVRGNPLKWINLGLLVLILVNVIFGSLLLTHYTRITIENYGILKRIQNRLGVKYEDFEVDVSYATNPFSLEKMVNGYRSECPPCPTTEPPTEVIINKDPVSVLNEEIGPFAVYECRQICFNPPVNMVTLTIAQVDGIWEAKAKTQKAAKQKVAFLAIKEKFSYLLSNVEYEEEAPYNPSCSDDKMLLITPRKC